jgi:hypothetical protein
MIDNNPTPVPELDQTSWLAQEQARTKAGRRASLAREESEPPGWSRSALGVPLIPSKSTTFDFGKPVAYDAAAKRLFHSRARSQLRRLARALGMSAGFYDLRSNPAGIAVSGEIILHTDRLYVQASQSTIGNGSGILFRSCKGRKDYVGGPNNFAPLDLLNNPEELAQRIRERCHV